ncbi:MAG TPA: hypothetical protein VLD57_00845, partial [Blastocatellia bacterium]|nr:hypothetical protein [Blastocatellia bacterium]
MASKGETSEKKKKIILAVLFLVMVIVVVYQLLLSEPAPRRRPQQGNAPGPATATTQSPQPSTQKPARPPSSRQAEEAYLQQLLSDTTRLDLAVMTKQPGSSQVGDRGNIFAYFVPPPPKPEPPPPPPPIDLRQIQPQTAVAGTPRQFTLTVIGNAFPADAQIIMDGRPRQTKRVNDTTLSTEVVPADYASPRNLNVEVKSQSDPAKLWSRGIPFIIQPAPEPQFKYIGKIGDQAVLEMSGTKEIVRMTKG